MNDQRRINWGRGFSRLSYTFLAIVTLSGLANAASALASGLNVGEAFAVTAGFAVGWLVFHHVVAWVAGGFRRE